MGNRLSKIYTRTGDDGTTGLFGGGRVAKASPRVEAYGTVDETNAVLGVARSTQLAPSIDAVLAHVQEDLFTLGAELACVPGKEAKLPAAPIGEADSRARTAHGHGSNARLDAVDLSADALEVARRNVADHGLAERIALLQGDLYESLGERRYDLILANPPYVDAESLAAFPPEFAAEPRLAHAGGSDGLDVVRRILARAREFLEPDGALVVEIGQGRARLEAEFPGLPLIWLDTQESEGEVFFIRASEWPRASRTGKRRP